MPYHFRIDSERNWLITTFRGRITMDELRAHLRQEHADNFIGYPEILDASEAQAVFTPAEVRDLMVLMRHYASTLPMGPTAVVVKDDFTYGMARMIEMLIEDVADVRPFRSLAEAEHWLASMVPRERRKNP